MASSNRTGLGISKKRSQQVLKTSIDILQEYSLWAKEEKEDPYMGFKDLHNIVYDDWRSNNKQVSWTMKEFTSLLASHARKPLTEMTPIEKKRKLNMSGVREIHYKVMEEW